MLKRQMDQSSSSTSATADSSEQPGRKGEGSLPSTSSHSLSNSSTPSLEIRLRQLRDRSASLSQSLTQRLATSPAGRSLLHIGPSLSTLPPDLHSLLSALHPLLADAESYEREALEELERAANRGNEIRVARRRERSARECADLYEDLVRGEADVRAEGERRVREQLGGVAEGPAEGEDDGFDELDHVASLERAAHTTLHLVQELKVSTASVSALTRTAGAAAPSPAKPPALGANEQQSTPLPSMRTPLPTDTEKAQFLMKLSPRIRRLEGDVVKCLTDRTEVLLKGIKDQRERDGDGADHDEEALLMIGHCLRGLALLGRGKEAENVFARVAIMPLVRSKISMGRLDEGGPRGECAGLFSLLDDMACSIADLFGPVLRLSESMFNAPRLAPAVTFGGEEDGQQQTGTGGGEAEVDLVTAGVWAPIATALMADPAVKMAIFSPGIASVLQANYTALDTFLSELASSLLRTHPYSSKSKGSDGETKAFEALYVKPSVSSPAIQRAQHRIYSHPMTSDFTKRWNLPIYYQLRFGECTSRVDIAISDVKTKGWGSDSVFTSSPEVASKLRDSKGFELPFFLELYDTLESMWRQDVVLKPLTHRFLRGAVQLLGRAVAFVRDGLEGRIRFGNSGGGDGEKLSNGPASGSINGTGGGGASGAGLYYWGERLEDVAAVAWELTVLETCMNADYLDLLTSAVGSPQNPENGIDSAASNELRTLASEVLGESTTPIEPIIDECWNGVIVSILISLCCNPLSAVKGVAATYRMTNRPPPTQSSPFVSTILRPLKEFDGEFESRTPPQVGNVWKSSVIETVSERYVCAVEELLATVQRTEVALKNRKATRRGPSGGSGISDGEKVKLQLYLDHVAFVRDVEGTGVDANSIEGIRRLNELTAEGEGLYRQTKNCKA